jgi:hypothetical protein
MVNQKDEKSKIGNDIIIVGLLGLLLLSVVPTIIGGTTTEIQSVFAQTEEPMVTPTNDTLKA